MDKATELLLKLDETITCKHLDMGGKHSYALTVRSWPVIGEIKSYLSTLAASEQARSSGAATKCPQCGEPLIMGVCEMGCGYIQITPPA